MLNWLKNRYLRIDPRSLGLFRIAMGGALFADLFHRWDWLQAFYSNNGVLPNHNHLFVLREKQAFWSALNAFSSEGENFAGFIIIALIYLAYLLGYHTRVAQVLTLICFVSLTGRNILLEGHANSLIVLILSLSLLLPLGMRYSIDGFRASMASRNEHDAAALNERHNTTIEHTPSLAALALMLALGGVLLFAALLQSGPAWESGDALYYALHTDRYTGAMGVWARQNLSPGVLNGWTSAFRAAEFALLPLILVPVARHYLRALAAASLLLVGGTIALFFTYGGFGWTLLACIPLLIPAESFARRAKGKRPLIVLYDEDCGICLYLARVLKRLDSGHNITFVGNAAVEDGTAADDLPERVTAELVADTIVVIDADKEVFVEANAMSQILRSLPLPWPLAGWALKVPGIAQLGRLLYNFVAQRRMAISAALGMGQCGIVAPHEVADEAAAAEANATPSSPAARGWFALRVTLSSAAAIFLSLAFLAQSAAQQPQLPLSASLAGSAPLIHAATVSRMMAAWDLWAPEPPRENAALVIDAETRDGWNVDVLTGYAPDLELAEPRRARKGVLWARFSDNIRREDFRVFQKELRRYLTRGGYAVDTKVKGNYISRLVAYWVHKPIPAPGKAASDAPAQREELLAHRRGKRGKTLRKPGIPSKNPPLFKPKKQ